MHNLLNDDVLCIEMCTFLPSPGFVGGSAAENQMGIMITIQQNKWLYSIYIRDGDGDGDTSIVPGIMTTPSSGRRSIIGGRGSAGSIRVMKVSNTSSIPSSKIDMFTEKISVIPPWRVNVTRVSV